jgi:hypothetical protein
MYATKLAPPDPRAILKRRISADWQEKGKLEVVRNSQGKTLPPDALTFRPRHTLTMPAAAQEPSPSIDEPSQGKEDAREFPHNAPKKMKVIRDQRQNLSGVP